MVVELRSAETEVGTLVTRVFLKAIDLLGGVQKLAEYRTLTWLPSLARASFVVVLREEYLKSEEEVAKEIGLTMQMVKNILRADPELTIYRIKHLEELAREEKKEMRVHTAGGIAKLAYRLVKEGQEDRSLLLEYCIRAATALDVPWAYIVLRRIKGTDFPIETYESINHKLSGVIIKGRDAEEVLKELEYPIRNPAELLHRIKENLKMHGID
ncbi:MAG TPA: bacterio-opsin activator [Aquificaceae bacterium]|nr:bacterio-opsin activator [Aquificaceae bacterium]